VINPGDIAPPPELAWPLPPSDGNATKLPLWLRAFDPQLDIFTSSVARSLGAIVIGNEATDFSLAMIYDRVLGYGLWLNPSMLDDAALCERTMRPALERMLRPSRGRTEKLQVTSVSLDDEAISRAAARLMDGPACPGLLVGGVEYRSSRQESISVGQARLRHGRRLVALRDPLGFIAAVPVTREDDATVTLEAPMPSVLPAEILPLRDQLSVPYWLVDVTIRRGTMPEGRGLRPRWLYHDAGPGAFSARVRASRDGLTYAAQVQGFILAGSNVESRIARPRLRQLGMRSWVSAMAEDHGVSARLSNPGTQAHLVAKRLGGRAELLNLISSANLALLRRFAPVSARTRSDNAFPEQDGVVLASDPFPTRAALEQLIGGDTTAVGTFIDHLTAARLLRRGLVLGCAECQRPSFVGIDEVRQTFRCQRCASTNELTSHRWRDETHDPHWYYDLHPSFRELIGAGGDLVVLAAAHLRKQARSYHDVAEMEFLQSSQRVAEIDVIALADDELLLVEVKASGTFGTGAERSRELGKKLLIAEMLRVEAIVLATSQSAWSETDVTELRLRAQDLTSCRPEIRTIASLQP
jgi:hypothetical protein